MLIDSFSPFSLVFLLLNASVFCFFFSNQTLLAPFLSLRVISRLKIGKYGTWTTRFTNWRSIAKTVNRECREIVTSCPWYYAAHLVSFRGSWAALLVTTSSMWKKWLLWGKSPSCSYVEKTWEWDTHRCVFSLALSVLCLPKLGPIRYFPSLLLNPYLLEEHSSTVVFLVSRQLVSRKEQELDNTELDFLL